MTKIILASKSPRRRFLFAQMGLPFECSDPDTDESFPEDMPVLDVAPFLALQKARALEPEAESLIITCDTTVVLGNEVINKPIDLADAKNMLRKLSGKMHTVVSGVCLMDNDGCDVFSCKTNVYFGALSQNEIERYVDHFKPLDKAGAYGIQEWIGYIGIDRIEGDYYNVMGLPLRQLHLKLSDRGFVPEPKAGI